MDDKLNILPYGDSALIIRLGTGISTNTNQRVHQLRAALLQQPIKAVLGLIPAYDTLTVVFDPWQTSFEHLEATLQAMGQQLSASVSLAEKRLLNIPVFYDGPDWAEVERQSGLSRLEAIEVHSQTLYQVFMLGFLPGFPYLGKLSSQLHCQRKESPRLRIPARSLGIAGEQTGIYPFASPGGWQLIGQTPVPLFYPEKEHSFLFSPGDQVRFYAIGEVLYEQLVGYFKNNDFDPSIQYA